MGSNFLDDFRKKMTMSNEMMMKAEEKKDYSDGCWKLVPDKESGVASAVIRFLPPKTTDYPFVLTYSHFYKENGQWIVVDKCPKSFGKPCPICDEYRELWNKGTQESQNLARQRKPRKQYIFNILVLKDNNHPENNGKVFPFKCGPAIYQIITDAITPQFGEEPKRPFDLYKGHNFNMKVRLDPQKNNLPNYDKSSFDSNTSSVISSDSDLERIYNEMIDLEEFKNQNVMSYEEIENKIHGHKYVRPENGEFESPFVEEVKKPAYPSKKSVKQEVEEMDKLPWDNAPSPSESSNFENDPTVDYFKSMVND